MFACAALAVPSHGRKWRWSILAQPRFDYKINCLKCCCKFMSKRKWNL